MKQQNENKKRMEGWKKYKLKDVIEKFIDYRGKTPTKISSGIPLVTAKIVKGGRINEPNEFISAEDYRNWMNRGYPKKNDILLTTEAPLGELAIISDTNIALAQRIITLRCDEEHSHYRFLKYLFESDYGQNLLQSRATGTTVLGIKASELRKIKLQLPPLPTQRRIASILSAYDDLIENNLKRIKLLEEMAQITYEEWFVRMKFPGHGNTKFDKETGLPEGWKVMKIGSLLSRIESSVKIKTHDVLEKGEIPVIDQSREFIKGYTNNKEALLDLKIPLIIFGDHTRILKFINFPFARGADGTQLLLSKEENMPQHLFYFSLLNVDLSNYHYARHFKFLKDIEIKIPIKEVALKYEGFAKMQFDLIRNLRHQNQRLKEARDILLPRLMTGMVDVEELSGQVVDELSGKADNEIITK